MNALDTHPDAVPTAPLPVAPSAIVGAVVAEIATALARLAETGAETTVGLGALTLTPDDVTALADTLGEGEVACELAVAGRSEVRETGFSGVWWIRHYSGDDRLVTEEIAVTRCPEILMSHPDDVAFAATRLATIAAPLALCSVEEPSRG